MRKSALGVAALAGLLIAVAGQDGAVAGTVQGSATYRERIALPPDATLVVELQDVSLADAPAVTLSAQRYSLNAVPAAYQLTYDDALVRDGMRYVVRGSIYDGRKLLFTTDTAYPVLTDGAGNQADLVLVQVSNQGQAMLENTKWIATEWGGEAPDTDKPPEISFGQDGAFGGSGGCNRFSGKAEISGNAINFPDNMAATLMACPPPYDEIERQFFKALQRVVTFTRAGNELILTDAAGDTVLRFILAQ